MCFLDNVPEAIKWLGDFSSCKTAGAFGVRLGHALTPSVPTIQVNYPLIFKNFKMSSEFNFSNFSSVF
jgi:hypothetical protein